MIKTAKQVIGDVIELLNNSLIAVSVNGKIYRGSNGKSYRPKGSKVEDIVIYHVTGDASQIQRGVIMLCIYIPDIEHKDSYIENGARCEEIEIIAQRWVSSLTSPAYNFKQMQTIFTEFEPEINQHYVVVKIKYELLTD